MKKLTIRLPVWQIRKLEAKAKQLKLHNPKRRKAQIIRALIGLHKWS